MSTTTTTIPRQQRGRVEGTHDHPKRSRSNVGSLERVVSVLAGGALTFYGLRQGDTRGILLALAGATGVYRGATGRCPIYGALGVSTAEQTEYAGAPPDALDLHASATIERSPFEVYERWRQFEDHPLFMRYIDSVQQLDERNSHWLASAPGGFSWEWETELIEDRPGERIVWRSLPGAEVANSGSVEFRAAPHARGTELRMHLRLEPPGGPLGSAIARLFGEMPEKLLRNDLRRFKQWIETGEITTTEGQPSGRLSGRLP